MLRRICFAAALILAGVAGPAQAQSDILLQLRSGSPAGDRVRVDSAGGFLALGIIGTGIIPASGSGWRMMWHPQKVAFRAGYVDGAQWDESNIGYYSWAGGALNTAAGIYSFAMGNQNFVEYGSQCGVALGSGNSVFAPSACGTAIGLNNDVFKTAGVAIGQNNISSGTAAVALGYTSWASGDYSMAFGYRASTSGRVGAKVFSDASNSDSLVAIANNEFAVRAAGGYRFFTNATKTTYCHLGPSAASFTCSSSKSVKENYVPADGEQVLLKMRDVPVNYWNIIGEPGKPLHIGPFAEDFFAAFRFGNTDKSIGQQDIDGVNFAAIKALEDRTRKLQEQITDRDKRIEDLETRLLRLEEKSRN